MLFSGMNLCCPRRLGVSPRPPQHRGVMFNAWSDRVGSYSATASVPRHKLGGGSTNPGVRVPRRKTSFLVTKDT